MNLNNNLKFKNINKKILRFKKNLTIIIIIIIEKTKIAIKEKQKKKIKLSSLKLLIMAKKKCSILKKKIRNLPIIKNLSQKNKLKKA